MNVEGVIPFWLVWCEQRDPPRYRHLTREAAEAEASRLAKIYPGKSFFVLAPVARVTFEALRVERFVTADDDVPF
jgi:hypothetical protein